MKVAIGYKIEKGPWGGGNEFAKSLSKFLLSKNCKVVYDLYDNDIDIILMTDPRGNSPQVTIDAGKVLRYLLFKNKEAIVIHRINECDERKNTLTMNYLLKSMNMISDHTIFIASWLRKLNLWNKYNSHSVILNGGDVKIFNKKGAKKWKKKFPLKIVTHHWGGNSLKGFDIYKFIDDLLNKVEWKEKIKFTYIGNLPKKYKFENIRVISPLSGYKLASQIKSNDIYLTASINEPGGMHHIEGALCGLPLLYRNSGALPEYCKEYGVSFNDKNDFINQLDNIINNYDQFYIKIKNYDFTAEKMCKSYYKLFKSQMENKKIILNQRKFLKNPWILLKNQFPYWKFCKFIDILNQ